MFATYFGDPTLVNEQVDRYRAVRAEDVNVFIKSRLGPDNRASLLYIPRDGDAESADVANLAATGV